MIALLRRTLAHSPRLYEAALSVRYFHRDLPSFRVGADTNAAYGDVFTKIYEGNDWLDGESRSGTGSNLAFTAPIRRALPDLIRDFKVSTLLDAPCGDFNWMRRVEWHGALRYVGADIVPSLIGDLQTRFGDESRRFTVLDVIEDRLPEADLWLCRDCFIHLSNAQVLRALRNFAASEIPYILTTNFDFGRSNTDIATGNFRVINLRRAPFNLPRPLRNLPDYVFPSPPRRLALWSREQVATALRA